MVISLSRSSKAARCSGRNRKDERERDARERRRESSRDTESEPARERA